jgi:small subunit ribosomal protein S4
MMSKRIVFKYKKSRQYNHNIWNITNPNFNINIKEPKNFKYYQYSFRFKEQNKFLLSYSASLTKKQLKKIYLKAKNSKGIHIQNFMSLFQRRIDVNIFLMNIAKTVFEARQLINHGYITINGKKIKNSNYLLKSNDLVQLKINLKNLDISNNPIYKNVLFDLESNSYLLLNSSSSMILKDNYNYMQEYLINFLYR